MSVSAHRAADGSLVCKLPDSIFEHFPTKNGASDSSCDLIFLVDSSGSMNYIWSNVARGVNAICDARPNTHILKWAGRGTIRRGKLLEDATACRAVDRRQGEGVGHGTNITAAAEILQKFLEELAAERRQNTLIVFVSDGQGDTYQLDEVCQSIRKSMDAAHLKLEMTTLGIGAGFPTHIAMSIRNALHSGRESLPLVSVVLEPTEFQEALDGLGEFIAPRLIQIEIADPTEVRVAPWSDFTKSVQLGVTVMLPAETNVLRLGPHARSGVIGSGKTLSVVVDTEPWTEADLVSFAKQLIWQLQAMSLQGTVPVDLVKQRARSALEIVTCAAGEVEAVEATESRDATADSNVKKSVFDRVARKKTRKSRFMLQALRKELRTLVEGSTLDSLSDAELKIRLTIGTMEGKFHERAMAFKGLTGDEFQERVREFVTLLRDKEKLAAITALADVEEDAGLRSAFSLECNADIWAQEQLAEALEKLKTQYALVECLPLVGLAVNVRRSSASMINPWACSISHLSALTPVLDSLSLLTMDGGAAATDRQGVKAFLNTGEGDNETVNAICSVVCSQEHAAAARPFLTSRLYQVLHTNNTCANVDTSDASSHPALLAAVVCYFLDQHYRGVAKDSTWIKLVLISLRSLYPHLGVKSERGFVSALIKESKLAVVTENPGISSKCQSISKPIALCLSWKDKIPENARPCIFSDIVKEWVGRAVGGRRNIDDWFSVTAIQTGVLESESGKEVSAKSIASGMDVVKFYTTVDALKALPKVVPTLRVKAHFDSLVFDKHDLLKNECRDGGVSFQTLVQFGRLFLGKKDAVDSTIITVDDLKRYVIHAIRYNSSFDRSQQEVETTWTDSIVTARMVRDIKRGVADALKEEIRTEVKSSWISEMGETHLGGQTHPMSLAAIMHARKARGMPAASEQELGYRADVGFCRNVCMCSTCPYFLEIHRGKAALHYNEADKSVSTAFSIAVSSCVRAGVTDPYSILQAVRSGKYMQYDDETRRRALEETLSDSGRWGSELEAVKSLIPTYQKLHKLTSSATFLGSL